MMRQYRLNNMLPDYPNLKKRLNDRFAELVQKEIDKDPFVGGIQKQDIHEGDSLTVTSSDGFSTTTDYPETASNFEISSEEILKSGPEATFAKKDEIAKDMIAKMTKRMIEVIDKVTEHTGNIVNAKEAAAKSKNPLLELYEKIELNFDEKGNPILPVIATSPQDAEKTKQYLKELESPEMQQKVSELIEKKRRQWLDRENSRKLVD